MNILRRHVLRQTSGVGLVATAIATGLLKPTQVLAGWNKAAFEARQKDAALAAIDAVGAEASARITVKAPDIAENGAVVPVEITTDLPDLESIAILSEKNINPLIGVYRLTDTDGYLSVRIKMAATAHVRAIVKAGGRLYTATREVKVTVGGCGG